MAFGRLDRDDHFLDVDVAQHAEQHHRRDGDDGKAEQHAEPVPAEAFLENRATARNPVEHPSSAASIALQPLSRTPPARGGARGRAARGEGECGLFAAHGTATGPLVTSRSFQSSAGCRVEVELAGHVIQPLGVGAVRGAEPVLQVERRRRLIVERRLHRGRLALPAARRAAPDRSSESPPPVR